MAATQDADKYFWLAYCEIVRSLVGPINQDDAMFFATTNQAGPAADNTQLVPAEYTNAGIFHIGDSLLDPFNPLYTQSENNSYIRSVLK